MNCVHKLVSTDANSTNVYPQDLSNRVLDNALVLNDLLGLTIEERRQYYVHVCQTLGLNPYTKPLKYIMLEGKLTLYACKDATDQLRKINGISLEIVERSVKQSGNGELIIVHVRAKDNTGRVDEDIGVVAVDKSKDKKNDDLIAANSMMKAVTKAKRRVTLSISGLGFLDETEVEDIPSAVKIEDDQVVAPVLPSKPALVPESVQPPVNPETGTVSPHRISIVTNCHNRLDWIRLGTLMAAAIRSSTRVEEVDEWMTMNEDLLNQAADAYPKVSDRLLKLAHKTKTTLAQDPLLSSTNGTLG